MKVDTNDQEQCDGFSTKEEVMMYEPFVPKKGDMMGIRYDC